MAALSTAIIVGAGIAAAGAVTAGAIASRGAEKAAETAAESNQAAIQAQQQAQERQLSAEEKAAAEQKAAAEKAAAEKKASLAGFKYPGILETPEGIKLKGTLEERMAGVGVGYTPKLVTPSLVDINKTTAPFAVQRTASLKDIEIPAIFAEASSRGLGRSTIPVNRIASSSQAASRDIESRVAELTLVNKELERQAGITNAELERQAQAQKSVDIQNALTQYGGLTTEQARAKQIEAQTRLTGEFDIADTEMGSANSRFAAAGVAANQRLASSETISALISSGGKTQAAYDLQQAALIGSGILNATSSFSKAFTQSNDEIIQAIKDQKAANGARVNIAGIEETAPTNKYRLLPYGG